MKNPYDEKIRHRGIKAVSALRDIVTSHEISDANSSSEEWCHRRVVQALQNDLEALERDQIPGHPRIPESEQGYAVIVRRLHNAHNALA